jgi:hypothetical protein
MTVIQGMSLFPATDRFFGTAAYRRFVPIASLRSARRTAAILGVAPRQLFPKAIVSRRRPPCRFGRIADATADPTSSKSGNGDLQHLREITLRSA